MLILYYNPTCPFCQRVLQTAENLGVEFDLRDIIAEEKYAEELEAKGGERQVPFLIDEEKGVSMYESSDIIDYIRENRTSEASAGAVVKPRVHISDATCTSCEG